MDKATRDTLILRFSPMVKNIVSRMTARLPIDKADKEALINVGILGLMDALDKFDPSRNVQFETYAKFRIKGAVLDELRAHDWIPRSVRDKNQKIEHAISTLKRELKRAPTEEEIALNLGITIDDYHKLITDGLPCTVISASELAPEYIDAHAEWNLLHTLDQGNPLDMLTNKETRELLKKAIHELPEKERLVLTLYYYEELTMKEIGEVLRITESRVCQLHSQALLRLRSALGVSNGSNSEKAGARVHEKKSAA